MKANIPANELLFVQQLLSNADFAQNAFPVFRKEFFTSPAAREIYALAEKFYVEYGKLANRDVLAVELEGREDLSENVFQDCNELIPDLFSAHAEIESQEWLMERAQSWMQERAIFEAIYKCLEIMDGKSKKLNKNSIPELLQDALGVSFDNSVGHDYFEDAEERYDFYHSKEAKIPFSLRMLNKVTNGGMPKKTVGVIIAPTGKGKSIFLGNEAAFHAMEGRNVLYISMELAEEYLAKRLDAKLMDVKLDMVEELSKQKYLEKIKKLSEKTSGRLIIKEYPTSGATVPQFRALIREARIKHNFVPDIVCIDYINIVSATGNGDDMNTYLAVKQIIRDFRALAKLENVVVLTASQTTRSAMVASDFSVSDISESVALSHTADFVFGMIQDDAMEHAMHARFKLLKNRFGPMNEPNSFLVGLDKSHMRFFDLENSAAVFDSTVAQASQIPQKPQFGQQKKSFSGFKT